jgi:hypothetical protein
MGDDHMKYLTAILVLMLLCQGLALGQDSTDEPAMESGKQTTAKVGRRSTESFWTWDFGALYRFSGDTYGPTLWQEEETAPRYFFSLDIARLKPSRTGLARGFSLGFVAESDSWRLGLNYRFRKLLDGNRYFEFAPGILIADSASRSDPKFPGFTAQAALGLSRFFGLVGRVDSRRKDNPDGFSWTDTSWYGGLRMSSYAGVSATLAGGLVVGALAAMASSWN